MDWRCCHGKRHQSLCRQKNSPRKSSAPNDNSQDMPNTTLVSLAIDSHTIDSHTMGTQSPRITTTPSSEMRGHVLLQTTTAIATNEDGSKSTRVKILFNCRRQHSYVTDSLKSRLSLKLTRSETLHLNTFGEKNFRKQKMRCCNFAACECFCYLFSCCLFTAPDSSRHKQLPAFARITISGLLHSHDLIDVLIGSNHYWDLVTNEILHGDFGPTAVKSKFGWLLSGLTKFATSSETTVTNLIILGPSSGSTPPKIPSLTL